MYGNLIKGTVYENLIKGTVYGNLSKETVYENLIKETVYKNLSKWTVYKNLADNIPLIILSMSTCHFTVITILIFPPLMNDIIQYGRQLEIKTDRQIDIAADILIDR